MSKAACGLFYLAVPAALTITASVYDPDSLTPWRALGLYTGLLVLETIFCCDALVNVLCGDGLASTKHLDAAAGGPSDPSAATSLLEKDGGSMSSGASAV